MQFIFEFCSTGLWATIRIIEGLRLNTLSCSLETIVFKKVNCFALVMLF